MRSKQYLQTGLLAACLSIGAGVANATEYGLSTYGLGGNAFGAGITPPPGTYLTTATGFYSGNIGGNINFGGIVFNAGAKLDFLSQAVNGLHVFKETILGGGHVGLSVTVPVGYIDIEANVSVGPLSSSRSTDGSGFGDIVLKAQLGWQVGAFLHSIYLQGVAPTGRYDVGFSPNIGLNRPGIDTGWAFTYIDQGTKLQFNGAAGVTFNFENDATNYKSGNEFHFEWAIGREFAPGLLIGVVGYSYRQLTGDSGAGAVLGDFKGRVDAIGPGLSYTTLIRTTPLILNLRHYQEFNADHRFEGSTSIASATMRF